MTKKKDDNHFLGKTTGYSLIEGVYHIAPTYTQAFDKLLDRSNGVAEMVNGVITHAAEINKQIASAQRQLWDMVCDDLGLDRSEIDYHYHYYDGTIHQKEKQDKPV